MKLDEARKIAANPYGDDTEADVRVALRVVGEELATYDDVAKAMREAVDYGQRAGLMAADIIAGLMEGQSYPDTKAMLQALRKQLQEKANAV